MSKSWIASKKLGNYCYRCWTSRACT